MTSVPEILAPAGGMPQLEAAVRSGADAVYLGASSLNARCSAANFTDEQLRQAAEYCHIRGVRLYLALNTLIFDGEFSEAERIISLACRLGIDGLIVQDIGLAAYISETAPQMRLHASTQCSVQSCSGLRMLRRLGFCRAVVARELSYEELSELASGSPVELEYFVHGALCMSVSGQCWLSAVIGRRSGNRGRCAQPCRLPFRDGGFMNCLSLKDSSLIPHIPKLASIGIASLKIEGRLKRPEYCAAVTDACVRARDSAATGNETDGRFVPFDDIPKAAVPSAGFTAGMDTLAAVFSRSGFTDGYFTGVAGNRCGRRDMFGIRTKEDVAASDSGVFAKIHLLYKNERSSVPVAMKLSENGRSFILSVSDETGNHAEAAISADSAAASDSVVSEISPSVVSEISPSAVSEISPSAVSEISPSAVSEISPSAVSKLRKTGGTPYFVKSLDIDEESIMHFLPPSAAGKLRREALEKLSEKRAAVKPVPVNHRTAGERHTVSGSLCGNITCENVDSGYTAPKRHIIMPEPHSLQYSQCLDMVFRSAAQIPESFPKEGKLLYGRAFLPLETPAKEFERASHLLREHGIETAVECARGMFGLDRRITELLEEKKALGAGVCMAHNLGAVQLVLDSGLECCGGFGLNITNTRSLTVLERLGLISAELSLELTAAQIRELGGCLPRCAVIYGRLPLMLTRCCPASLETGCRGFSAAEQAGTAGTHSGVRFCSITDRLGKVFPVICREGCSEVLNTVPLSMSDKLREFSSAERLTARFSLESAGMTADIIGCIMNGVTTRGCSSNEDISPAGDTSAAGDEGITHGLYFRGVI